MKKIAFITGATSGIGKACAEKFASDNYNLILTGRRKKRLKTIKKNIEKRYDIDVKILNFDVRNFVEVKSAINSLPDKWQNIYLLINNAGLAAGLDTIQEGKLEDWEQMIDTNIKGLLYVSKLIMPKMIKRKKGHIINIGSIAGKEVYPKGNVYCATKHAVDALTKAMRIDLLPYKIKVSQIAPGAVETEFSIIRLGNKQAASKVYEGYEPLHPEDIADACHYVASLPKHVNINDLLIMPTAQANAITIDKKQ